MTLSRVEEGEDRALPTSSTLRVTGLGFRYRRKTVLRDVTFTAGPGVTAVLGPNGAGKSTLFQLLAGALQPAAGGISLVAEGQERELAACRPQIGFMPQDARFFPRFTARDFVVYCAWLRGIPTKQRAAAAEHALRAAGVLQVADQRLTKLSGGMRQRANLASALVNRPQLLLLDEPTNSLDIENRAAFRRLIRAQSRDRVTLVSSHDVDQVEAVADQLLVLRGGRVLYSGTTERFLRERGAVRLEAAYLHLLRGR